MKKTVSNLPTIALVGRVNVGKSTLFNRLIEEHKAIVSDTPGTTRTSNEGVILWRGKQIKIIDTGGLTFDEDIRLEEDILKQSEKAMKVADLVMFVVDAKEGLLPQERQLAKRMRRIITKPVIVIANKVDKSSTEINLPNNEFYKLGLGDVFPISATSGRNIGDLLDHTYKILQKGSKRPKIIKEEDKVVWVSLIGKPNVGKSSLFNKLIGEDKVIVSDLAHTTREPHDTLIIHEKNKICFVDTAGIRRKARVSGKLEREGIQKSIDSIEKSDIVLFVVDGSDTISQQDKQLGALVERRGKSVILLVNKWDLAEDTTDFYRKEVTEKLYAHFPHLKFAPISFVSGKTGYHIHQIFPLILQAAEARKTEIPRSQLEKLLDQIIRQHKPARGKGTRQPKILAFKQLGAKPPVFELMIKYRTSLHRSYVNFVERKLRENYNFFATPIIIKLSKMKR
jgi:GTPase